MADLIPPPLRDYQYSGVDAVFNEWKEVVSTLGSCATGGGKTAIASEVIRRVHPARSMFICHREELVFQAYKTIKRFTGLECGIEMGDLRVEKSLFGEPPVIIATVQTLNSSLGDRTRMSRYSPHDFGCLIADEFHHALSPSWANVINYMRQNPDLRVLGITGTADRSDQQALGQICDSVAFDYEILDLIHWGWLVPVEQQFVTISGLDFSHMRTTAGDLNGADLAAVMESENNMQGVAAASIEIIKDKRTIVFTSSVKQAEVISNIFNRHKPGISEWVCGKTNKDARRDILSKFETGQVQIVCNCGVLTEGFDNPAVEVIVMARPTKSRSLFAQMAGRSTRPLPGVVDGLTTAEERRAAIASSPKKNCLIVDFVGNSGKHKLVSVGDLLGGKVSDEAIHRAVIKAKQSSSAVRMSDALDEAEEEIRQEADQRRMAEEARKAKLVARVSYSARSINPFDVLQISPVKERGWDSGRTLSQKQAALLLSNGINPDTLSYAQGRQVLNAMFERWNKKLATLKQLNALSRFGYTDKEMTMEAASKLLDAISQNGWRKL